VVNSTIWQPLKPSADEATKSFPGEESRFKPFVLIGSAYFKTSTTVATPPFCIHPSDLSSSVEMPPFLLPGDGFS
jgi:hypothetical protein